MPSCAGAGPGERRWRESPLTPVDAHFNGVRWEGAFTVDAPGRTQWTIQAWVDLFAGWRDELARKVEFGQPDLSGELSEGAVLLQAAAAERAKGEDRSPPGGAPREAIATDPHAALDPALLELVESVQERTEATELPAPLEVDVDRTLARFGSWYELFPRSWGGFKGVQAQLPRLAELGFDVLYMPPIHPIGHTNRKGRNNTLTRRARRSRQPLRDRRRDAAATTRSTPSWAPTRTSARWSRPRTSTASTSASTSRSTARRTTRG